MLEIFRSIANRLQLMIRQNPRLRDNNERTIIFPVKHNNIWEAYKAIEGNLWTAGDIEIENDLVNWQELNNEKRLFLNKVIGIILSSEKNLNGKLPKKISADLKLPEASYFLDLQVAIENTHTQSYNIFFNSFLSENEQLKLFREIEASSIITAREEWISRWTNSSSFGEKLVALATAKSIISYGSFAAIFWVNNCGILPGFSYTYEKIYRDKALHRDFATQLFREHLLEDISPKKVQQIIGEAIAVEKEVISGFLPLHLIGLEAKSLNEYLEYESNRLFKDLMRNRLMPQKTNNESLLEKRAKSFSKNSKTDNNSFLNQSKN